MILAQQMQSSATAAADAAAARAVQPPLDGGQPPGLFTGEKALLLDNLTGADVRMMKVRGVWSIGRPGVRGGGLGAGRGWGLGGWREKLEESSERSGKSVDCSRPSCIHKQTQTPYICAT